jgi:hypothetical protein
MSNFKWTRKQIVTGFDFDRPDIKEIILATVDKPDKHNLKPGNTPKATIKCPICLAEKGWCHLYEECLVPTPSPDKETPIIGYHMDPEGHILRVSSPTPLKTEHKEENCPYCHDNNPDCVVCHAPKTEPKEECKHNNILDSDDDFKCMDCGKSLVVKLKPTALKTDKPKEECKHDWRQDKTAEGYINCVKCGAVEKITQPIPLKTKPERSQWKYDLALLMGKLVGPRDAGFDKPLEDFIEKLLPEPVKSKPEIEKMNVPKDTSFQGYTTVHWFEKMNELIDRVNFLSAEGKKVKDLDNK